MLYNLSAFTCFDEWLDAIEQAIEGYIVLLALDEFEALDKALSDKRFDETSRLRNAAKFDSTSSSFQNMD